MADTRLPKTAAFCVLPEGVTNARMAFVIATTDISILMCTD